MSTTVYTNNKHYQDIANAIRAKNGTENTYTPSQMANAILALEAGEAVILNQNKSIIPSTSEQSITFDSGYTGLGTVTVGPIPNDYLIPSGSITITENGTTNVAQYASAIVNVPTGSTINNQNKTVIPTISQQTVTADSGYTGLGTVTVEGDADLLAANIKSGVNIFGVTGTLTSDQPLLSETSNATGITANITTIEPPLALGVKNISTSGTYYASTDSYDGYSQVIVDAPIPTGTTISKIVGEGQSISKGDFITLNDDYWCFTPNIKLPFSYGNIGLGMLVYDSNPEETDPIIAFSRPGVANNAPVLSACQVNEDNIEYIMDTNTDSGYGYMYSSVVYLEDYKILWISRRTGYTGAFIFQYAHGNGTVPWQAKGITLFTNNAYSYSDCVALSSTSALFVYNVSNTLYGVILTIDGVNITKGTETQLSSSTYSNQYSKLCVLDSSHVLITHREGSDKVAQIITIESGIPSLSNYSCNLGTAYSKCTYLVKQDSTHVLVPISDQDTFYLKQLTISENSITASSPLWSGSEEICGIALDTNNIGMLLVDDKKLYFVLLSSTGTELQRVQICDYISTTSYKYLDLILAKSGRYVAAYSSYDNFGKLWACLSLITWDGTTLNYKNDHLESYNGESLYGIALEDGEEGDTIQVLIPQVEEEVTENDNL